ncbi:DUF3618 domain-containing protein [Streptomyces sp. NPDC016459]|uniref:DUF3618 domain-containing protein n=1 Tax=Streptomyces sp. NPDC016459 TaxID=3157190 RepID=UPI0033F419F8
MGTTPEELRRDREHRRAHLARNVDLLADRLTPRRMAQRKADSVRHGLTDVKERVMGTAHDRGQQVADGAGHATDSIAETARGAVGSVSETVQSAPARARRGTEGSPLAAGIMAFGAGMLAAALLPTTKAEERAGQHLKEHSDELLGPVKETAVEAAQEIKEQMREPVTEAVESVRSTAQDAAATTKDDARTAGQETAQDMRRIGQDTAGEVRSISTNDR